MNYYWDIFGDLQRWSKWNGRVIYKDEANGMEVAVKQFQITQKTAWVVASNTQKNIGRKNTKN